MGEKVMKKVWLLFAIIAMLVLVACGADESSTDDGATDAGNSADGGESFLIGATQIVEHPSLDQAYKGFQEALEEEGVQAEFDFQSAQNDQNNVKPISDGF